MSAPLYCSRCRRMAMGDVRVRIETDDRPYCQDCGPSGMPLPSTGDAPRCICGHAENLHYGPSGRCMKIITRHYSGNVDCTCKLYSPERASSSSTPHPESTDERR